jgi:pimeloyl-ACP methyl ester carboxylesterase
MHFESLQQAADALRTSASSFGPHTPGQWLELSRHMTKPDPRGGVHLHYDPAIALPFQAITEHAAVKGEAALWGLYDAIGAQTLLVRGADSDLLSPFTAQQMTQRGPHARLVEFAGVGHAPTFVADDQVDTVAAFLLG